MTRASSHQPVEDRAASAAEGAATRVAVIGASGQVGRRLEAELRRRGHEVVGLSRSSDLDATDPDAAEAFASRLAGADAVVDVTNRVTQDPAQAARFFTTVARAVGTAARHAGVRRTVLLSIVGVDRIPYEAHYAAKHLQERTYLEHAPGVLVVRSAHFHEFVEMAVGWGSDGSRSVVPDFPVQPVEIDVVVDALVAAATGGVDRPRLEVAGPRRERLPDLAKRLVRSRGDAVEIVAGPAGPELSGGACLPGPDALIAGRPFDDWLASR